MDEEYFEGIVRTLSSLLRSEGVTVTVKDDRAFLEAVVSSPSADYRILFPIELRGRDYQSAYCVALEDLTVVRGFEHHISDEEYTLAALLKIQLRHTDDFYIRKLFRTGLGSLTISEVRTALRNIEEIFFRLIRGGVE